MMPPVCPLEERKKVKLIGLPPGAVKFVIFTVPWAVLWKEVSSK
jgi:hypothetical protein